MNRVKRMLSFLVLVTLFIATLSTAAAEIAVPFASETYVSCTASLNSSKSASFNVTTSHSASIYVKSVKLQKKNGGKPVNVKSLTTPSKTASGRNYSDTMSYSDSIPDDGTYRIQAVFSADGETRTVSSSWVTF